MAKKSSLVSDFGSKSSLFDLVGSIDKSAEILSGSHHVIKEYISTGNYIVNAAMTGSLFKGVPSGRVITLAGEESTGKTFLALSICKCAQKMGYTPVYLDSENSIDIDFVERLGCDSSNFIIRPTQTISDMSTFVANLTDRELALPEDQRHKIIIVIDSVGNLTSDKEKTDIMEGSQKRDMTKQQELKAFFRTAAVPLGQLQIPCVVISHVYQTLDLYAQKKVSGGSGIAYNASLTFMLSVSKLDDKESDKIALDRKGDVTKTGVLVTATTKKSRFTIPHKVKFQIPFFKSPNPYVGLEEYITWENSGILRGKLLTVKEYSKLSESDKACCYKMTDETGNEAYAFEKDTAKTIVVEHLHKELPLNQLFTKEVFSDEVLKRLDDNVIRPLFELPKQDSDADINELVGENEY
jgi:RecA/RadA recombinase